MVWPDLVGAVWGEEREAGEEGDRWSGEGLRVEEPVEGGHGGLAGGRRRPGWGGAGRWEEGEGIWGGSVSVGTESEGRERDTRERERFGGGWGLRERWEVGPAGGVLAAAW